MIATMYGAALRTAMVYGEAHTITGERTAPMPTTTDSTASDMIRYGTNEDALDGTKDRHPGVRDALLWLAFGHLPPALQPYSRPLYTAACQLIEVIPADSPELTTALNLLVQAKDSAVRAGIKSDQGRAGSVPRPQTVVDPPRPLP